MKCILVLLLVEESICTRNIGLESLFPDVPGLGEKKKGRGESGNTEEWCYVRRQVQLTLTLPNPNARFS